MTLDSVLNRGSRVNIIVFITKWNYPRAPRGGRRSVSEATCANNLSKKLASLRCANISLRVFFFVPLSKNPSILAPPIIKTQPAGAKRIFEEFYHSAYLFVPCLSNRIFYNVFNVPAVTLFYFRHDRNYIHYVITYIT